MEQYIDKAAVVAEINNWIKDARSRYTLSKVQFSLSDRIESLENLLSFLDTLEVKEIKEPIVDLEEEIENELERTWYGEYLDTDKFKESAVYFFELGLKVQKGE